MEEHKNREKHVWAEHGKVKYNDLINQLLEDSTNSRNLPQEEKNWITHSMQIDCSMPFYKADKFVGGAQITPYKRLAQYLLEVQGRQNLVEFNEYQIDLKEIELERDEEAYNKSDPNTYNARLLKVEINEHQRAIKQLKVNLRFSQKERNQYLRLIREFNDSPIGKYKDGRLLIDLLDDDDICEELEEEHWTYRMAKQCALDWIAYGRPGIGNMDAIFQMGGEQQEKVMSLAIELYTKNELRNNRLQAEVNKQLEEGAPSGELVSLLEIEMFSKNDEQERKKLENVRTIQARIASTGTKHPPTSW